MNTKFKQYTCIDCGCSFSKNSFDGIDDEVSTSSPRCPDCQYKNSLIGQECEYCDNPATYEISGIFLCDYHHDDYADGWFKED